MCIRFLLCFFKTFEQSRTSTLLTSSLFTFQKCYVKLEIIHAGGPELNSTMEDVSVPI